MMRRRWGAVHTVVAALTFASCAIAPGILGGPIIVAARVAADITFEIHFICISYSTCSQPEAHDSIVSNHARPLAANPATPGQVHDRSRSCSSGIDLNRVRTVQRRTKVNGERQASTKQHLARLMLARHLCAVYRYVRNSGQTGSHRPTVKTALMTHKRHAPLTVSKITLRVAQCMIVKLRSISVLVGSAIVV